MMSRGQWYHPIDWPGWGEKELIASAKAAPPSSVPDNASKEEVVLVDKFGHPLVVRRPRPVGFRMR